LDGYSDAYTLETLRSVVQIFEVGDIMAFSSG